MVDHAAEPPVDDRFELRTRCFLEPAAERTEEVYVDVHGRTGTQKDAIAILGGAPRHQLGRHYVGGALRHRA